MEALIVKAGFSKINLIYFSICLRTAYLYMDRTGLAGDMWMSMYLGDDFCSIPMMMKYKLLKDYKEEAGMEYDTEKILKIEKHHLKESKMKHRPVEGYNLYKRSESGINAWLKERKNINNQLASNSGLLPLKEIIEEDVFTVYKLDKREQVPNLSPNIFVKTSELLQLQYTDHHLDSTLFTLTDDFTDPDFLEDRRIHDINNMDVLMEDSIILTKCLTFPVTSELSAGELKILRNTLEESTTAFNEVIDIWVDMFIEKQEKAERVDFLRNEIQLMLPSIQKVINENETLCYAYKRHSDITVEVWLGEAPLPLIWEYYNYFELISDVSYKVLLDSLENTSLYNFNVPIMMIATKGEGRNKIEILDEFTVDEKEEEEEEEPDVLPVRKSILITD